MSDLSSVITRKGQVTIPAEVRRRLGLQEGDRVTFTVNGDQIQLKRGESVVARTAGVLSSDVPFTSVEEEKAAVETAIADDVARRSS